MPKPLIDVTYTTENGTTCHLEVSKAPGGGQNYHVYANNGYQGCVVLYNTGWTILVNEGILSARIIARILEVVKETDDRSYG